VCETMRLKGQIQRVPLTIYSPRSSSTALLWTTNNFIHMDSSADTRNYDRNHRQAKFISRLMPLSRTRAVIQSSL